MLANDVARYSRQDADPVPGVQRRWVAYCQFAVAALTAEALSVAHAQDNGIRFVVTEKIMPGGNSIFIASRLKSKRNNPDRALRLAKGRLRFVDWTQAGQVQILAKAQMTALTQDDGSYLKKWDERRHGRRTAA